MPREWIDALDAQAEAAHVSRSEMMRTIVSAWLCERKLISPPPPPGEDRTA